MSESDDEPTGYEGGELVEREDGFNPDDPDDALPALPWHVQLVEWVQEHFAKVEFYTDAQKIRWCPTWWEHPEAVERLKALWMAHQALEFSLEMEAVSNWWLHHWDAHRAILFHDKGPFRNCDAERGHLASSSDKRVLPIPAAPPEDWIPSK
jgi:hypothetical protein